MRTAALVLAAAMTVFAQDAARPKKMTVVTYNILGDGFEKEKRWPALLKILSESMADIIALQEVVPAFLALLAKEDWAKGYVVAKVDGNTGGQYILSRWAVTKSKLHVLSGRQRRTALLAHVETSKGESLAVATMHMESPLEAGKTRANQLDGIFGALKGGTEAIALGDFNFGDGEQPDTGRLDPAYTDVWTALKGRAPGLTYDLELNPLADAGKFKGEKSRRIDRILVRSATWKATEIRIIGAAPLADDPKLFPSDHYGLRVVLARD